MKMKRKILIGSIIAVALLVLVSFSSTVAKISVDNELVEVTTEFCGIDGLEPYTVKMSEDDFQELKEYLNEFKENLDTVESTEEAIKIYNEAIHELDNYGLLGSLSIDRAKILVTGWHQNSRVSKLFEERFFTEQENSEDIENYLCLISGQTTITLFQPILSTLLFVFLEFYSKIYLIMSIFTLFSKLFFETYRLLYFFVEKHWNFCSLKQKLLVGADVWFIRSNGWVNTIGLMGNNMINGTFIGKVPFYIHGARWDLLGDEGRGVLGFTGLKLNLDEESYESFFIGNALEVRLGPEE